MKRWIACTLVFILLLSLSACKSFVSDVQSGMQDALEDAGEELNKTVTRGVISGDSYTSTFSGLSFQKSGTWRFFTDAELSAAMNASTDILDQDAFEKALASMVTVHDMMAMDDATGNNIVVSYENLALTNSTSITPESYIDAVEQQLAGQSGFSSTMGEEKTVTLSGNSYHRAECTMVYNGITMSQFFYVRKLDKYMSVIIVTVMDGTDISTVEAMFQG